MTIDDDRAWREQSFDDTTRDGFRSWKLDLATALRWRAAGVHDGLAAVRWTIIGASPTQSSAWRAAGFDSVEALQWHQTGHDLASASRARKDGLTPSTAFGGPVGSGSSGRTSMVARLSSMANGPVGPAFASWLEGSAPHQHAFRYAQMGWVTDDALPWAQADIPPEHARLWSLLGIRAPEAASLERGGLTALDAARQWWSAGVPLGQVAAWLGAGFTPEEAQQQMAAGVDAEQAAVLRALRNPTED